MTTSFVNVSISSSYIYLTVIEVLLHYQRVQLDPRKLLVLHAVVEHDGVQGAARALYVSPSAISQQLAALETQCGLALFDRTARKLRLTPAGESLINAAESIVSALNEATVDLSHRQIGITGDVTIGSVQSLIISRIAPALSELKTQHSEITVRVYEVHDAQIVRQVRSGELDLGLIEARPQTSLAKGLAEVPIADDPWRVVVPRAWARHTTKRLATRPWILTFDDARSDAFDALGVVLGAKPTVTHRCVEFPSVLALVRAGAGAAIVPQLALDLFGSNGISVVGIAGLGSRTITVVHRTARHEPRPAVRAVLDALAG
jgi:DNA-binding transcriptional LysR family regulator